MDPGGVLLAVTRLRSILDEILGTLPSWVVDIVEVGIVLVIAYGTSRLLVRLLGRRLSQRFRRPSLTRTALRGVRVSVFLLAMLVILRIFGLQLGDIALSVTVFSAAIGVVLAPIVGSIISGIFLLADQPYEIGDMVEIADSSRRGFVDDITLRYTKIFTLDNTFVVIPNGEIRKRDVVNYSAEDTRTRQTLDVVVTYEGDLDEARRIIERSARSVEGVIEGGPSIRVGAARYPAAPTCYIDTYGDHGVHLRLRYWLEEPYSLLAARSRIQTEIWSRLGDADVEIAYPHSHVVFDDTSGELPVSMSQREQPTPDVGGRSSKRRQGTDTGRDESADRTGRDPSGNDPGATGPDPTTTDPGTTPPDERE
jgi:small-conductance mechanosensitive channel